MPTALLTNRLHTMLYNAAFGGRLERTSAFLETSMESQTTFLAVIRRWNKQHATDCSEF